MEIAHGSLDGKFPAQVAAERLMEVKKADREIKLQSHRFYSYLPVTDLQRVAVEKLAPSVSVIQEWHFEDVLNVTTAETPIFTNLLYYSRRPPTLDMLGPWAVIWEEDQDLREILETFLEQSQVNSKSTLKSGIIQSDIHRLNQQHVEDCSKFAEDSYAPKLLILKSFRLNS